MPNWFSLHSHNISFARNVYRTEPGVQSHILEELTSRSKDLQRHEKFLAVSLDEMKSNCFCYLPTDFPPTFTVLRYLRCVANIRFLVRTLVFQLKKTSCTTPLPTNCWVSLISDPRDLTPIWQLHTLCNSMPEVLFAIFPCPSHFLPRRVHKLIT